MRKERRKRSGGPKTPPRARAAALPPRLLPAGLAATVAGWTAATLALLPRRVAAPGLAAAAAASDAARAERVGLVFALAVPFFPLANISLGLGLLFAGVAVVWLALTWRDPRAGLFVVAGPLLGAIAGLALITTRPAVRPRTCPPRHPGGGPPCSWPWSLPG